MNKDFYEELPGMVCAILDDLIEKYGDKHWFNQAWEEYRQHIKDNSMDDMKMPGYVFNKYIDNKKQQELKMNREIKFRIWDTEDKKFLSLKDYQDLGAIEVENDGTLTLSPRFRFLTSMMIMPERFIPLQYIGLKDKNGKEIYEGDIIDIHQTVNGYNQFVIEYYTYKFSARYYDKDKKVIGSLYNYDLDELFEINEFEKELEIVGNIYESEVEDNAK